MKETLLYCAGRTAAAHYAAEELKGAGVALAREPNMSVRHVLLDIPSFAEDGSLRFGGRLEELLAQLPGNVTVFGGNIGDLPGIDFVDLLKDPLYQAENAYITAECALEIALGRLTRTIRDCPVLILGWGRIGRCLAKILGALGAQVTVAARKQSDRAICQALGYRAEDYAGLLPQLGRFRLLFNTVPSPQLNRQQLAQCHCDCVKIELASKTGLEGEDIIIARGLPGIHMPESSGALIARTYLRLRKEE